MRASWRVVGLGAMTVVGCGRVHGQGADQDRDAAIGDAAVVDTASPVDGASAEAASPVEANVAEDRAPIVASPDAAPDVCGAPPDGALLVDGLQNPGGLLFDGETAYWFHGTASHQCSLRYCSTVDGALMRLSPGTAAPETLLSVPGPQALAVGGGYAYYSSVVAGFPPMFELGGLLLASREAWRTTEEWHTEPILTRAAGYYFFRMSAPGGHVVRRPHGSFLDAGAGEASTSDIPDDGNFRTMAQNGHHLYAAATQQLFQIEPTTLDLQVRCKAFARYITSIAAEDDFVYLGVAERDPNYEPSGPTSIWKLDAHTADPPISLVDAEPGLAQLTVSDGTLYWRTLVPSTTGFSCSSIRQLVPGGVATTLAGNQPDTTSLALGPGRLCWTNRGAPDYEKPTRNGSIRCLAR